MTTDTDRLPKGKFWTTSSGPTFVRSFGSGPPLLAIHGGPGMAHSYLVEPLSKLAEFRTLVFYDQWGCGRDNHVAKAATADKLMEQLVSLAEKLGEGGAAHFSVFAHSWGAYLALMLLCHSKLGPLVSELVLVSPLPLTRLGLDNAFRRLYSRIPENEAQRLAALVTQLGQGSDAMFLRAALPYYVADPAISARIYVDFYSREVNQNVIATLRSYDLRAAAMRLPTKSLLIQGDQDFVTREDIRALYDHSRFAIVLEGVGHFPFVESPNDFWRALGKLLT